MKGTIWRVGIHFVNYRVNWVNVRKNFDIDNIIRKHYIYARTHRRETGDLPSLHLLSSFFFFKDFIYLFLERGERKEKEREWNINVWLPLVCSPTGAQACALTGNGTGNTLVRRLALNPLSHTSQGPLLFLHSTNIYSIYFGCWLDWRLRED